MIANMMIAALLICCATLGAMALYTYFESKHWINRRKK